MRSVVWSALVVAGLGACSVTDVDRPTVPNGGTPVAIPTDARPSPALGLTANFVHTTDERHGQVAWFDDDRLAITAAEPSGLPYVTLVDLANGLVDRVPMLVSSNCVIRIRGTLQLLTTREMGFPGTCTLLDGGIVQGLYAFDLLEHAAGLLAETPERPSSASWNTEMSRAWYAVGRPTCRTVYSHNGGDGPVGLQVGIQGDQIPLGEDLSATAGSCTMRSNADLPAFSPYSPTVALFAASTGDRRGDDRLDQPWSLVLIRDDETSALVVDGIHRPVGVGWLANEYLVFTGEMSGKHGLWAVRSDGVGLEQLTDTTLESINVAPDGTRVVGIQPAESAGGVEPTTDAIVWYDLRAFLESRR